MSFSLFTSLAVNGIAMGMIYALLGMGLILLVRALGILNFAQGDLMMFGAYIAACLLLDLKLPLPLMLLCAFIWYALIGIRSRSFQSFTRSAGAQTSAVL